MPNFLGSSERMIEMDITGIAKSHQANSTAVGKASSKKGWKLTDSLQKKITALAKEDAAQNVYMGNQFLAMWQGRRSMPMFLGLRNSAVLTRGHKEKYK